MLEQARTRLAALKEELEKGRTELDGVERHRAYLRETMLRIGGAIQVLEELLSEEPSRAADPSHLQQIPHGKATNSHRAKASAAGATSPEDSDRSALG